MLEKENILQLNSNNVSVNTAHTKAVTSALWGSATSAQKREAVKIGGYANTKSFKPVRDMGKIAVRMAVTLAIVFNADPFYIIGEKATDNGLTEDVLREFLQKFGFKTIANSVNQMPRRVPILGDGDATELDSKTPKGFDSLSEDDAALLLKALYTQARLNNPTALEKLLTVKKLLVH